MQIILSEIEYNDIAKEVDFYCDYYGITAKKYNSDFIFTVALNRYIEYARFLFGLGRFLLNQLI